MKDIEKMRREFERKIWCAEKSNEIEQRIGVECDIMEHGSYTQKGKEWLSFGDVNFEQARKILREFPWTERAKRTKSATDSSVIELPHLLQLHRYPKDCDKLEVEWIHNEYAISLKIPIKPDTKPLYEFFKADNYQLNSDSIGLYYGCVSPGEADVLSRQHALSFKGGSQIRYQGGYFFQTDEDEAERIVATIIGE